jgi:hypothetical protein
MVLLVATEKKSPVTPPGIDPKTIRLVAQCLNHYATPGPCTLINISKISSCLYRASTVSKHFLFFHNGAHNCKITGILKQLKFRRSLQHVLVHSGTIIREPFLCLAKTTVMVLYPRHLWCGQCHGSIPACCAGVRYTMYSYGSISSSFMTWSVSWQHTSLLCGCAVHRVPHTRTTGWYAAMTLTTS